MTRSIEELTITAQPLNAYGSLESVIRDLRRHRPLTLNADVRHQAHPQEDFTAWQQQARACLQDGLHYDPGTLDLRAEVLARTEHEGFVLERVAFNTTPWFRVEGYFLLPTGVPLPVPGLVVFHAWGGPMIFGKERIVNTGRDHPLLAEHRDKVYSGQHLAEVFARAGYAAIVIDAYHFGERAPRGINQIPASYDPFDLPISDAVAVNRLTGDLLYLGVRQLNWAGTTWMGVNYWDDSRCVDYLLSRPEVDPKRIGCTGLSGGGWRTNMLAALDARIRAAVSAGWMTTGDHQQLYNISGAVGTFCLLPGVWQELDVPDLIAMSASCASMVVVGEQDNLFPTEGVDEAGRQIAAAYTWAGCPERFRMWRPSKIHCYDADVQREAITWLDRWLKA